MGGGAQDPKTKAAGVKGPPDKGCEASAEPTNKSGLASALEASRTMKAPARSPTHRE
jgi:hypothetical protein